jgi:hypothetical protein
MSSGFTKTTLIECNRSQSDEAISNNNQNTSQWTNRTGTGLRLKVGDQITVHSSFISEIGAEAGEIQIKGTDLGKTVEVKTTEFTDSLFNDNLPQKFGLTNASNKTQTISLRDDTLNLVVSPYKCANGDNYIFLPRRYGASSSDNWWAEKERRDEDPTPMQTAFDLGQTYNPPPVLNRCKDDISTKYWPYRVGKAHQYYKVTGKNDGSRFTLFTRTQTFYGTPSSITYTVTAQAKAGSPLVSLTHGASSRDLLVGMELVAESPFNVFPAGTTILIGTHDHTLTMSENASANTNTNHLFSFRLPSSVDDQFLPPTTANSSFNARSCEAQRDPALFGNYIQVKNLISLKANPGYNSPTDLADQLTEEINERTDLEFFEYNTSNSSNTVHRRETFTFKTESPAYKMYKCGTATNFQHSTFNEWFKTDGSWNVNDAYHWLSTYQHIAIKRPEIYTTGLEVNGSNASFNFGNEGGPNGNYTSQFRPMAEGDPIFVTNTDWNKENLLLFRDFFNAQKTYPELFDYTQNNIQCDPTTTRFLHMNLYDNKNGSFAAGGSLGTLEWNFGENVRDEKAPVFGYDLYNQGVSASNTSFPFFIDYNPNTESFTENDVGYTDRGNNYFYPDLEPNYDDLAYGFGRKIRVVDDKTGKVSYKIGFQFTRTGNKIPDHFFFTNASARAGDPANQLGTGTRVFGFDWHFTSYGCLAMILWNGNVNIDGLTKTALAPWSKYYRFSQATQERIYRLDPYQFGLYLGADTPLINYDVNQQRFQISDLHTAETIGQSDSAGFNRINSVPDNPNSSDNCYKINKRPLGTNYTPELTPYLDIFSANYTGGSINTYVSHNVNIEPYRIMDASSGLFIEDWVVPENFWDESLVGIMGFRYNQFHNPNSLSSRQVRIKAHGANADLHNVNIITTNADVNEGDLITYFKNPQQANMNLPINAVATEPGGTGFNVQGRMITPAITISPVNSVKITAERLPTKTLRPYYTIRSDIISDQPNSVLGGLTGGITLPIVSVVNKANPYGDFLNGFAGQLTFTNTIDRVITRIRCSIHESNGEFARTDQNSAVIFKIDQQVDADLNLVNTLLQSKKKSDQQIAEEAEDPNSGLENFKYTSDIFQ